MRTFYWLRSRGNGQMTVAVEQEGRWTILGGLAGWWTRDQVEEDFEIIDHLPTPAPRNVWTPRGA